MSVKKITSLALSAVMTFGVTSAAMDLTVFADGDGISIEETFPDEKFRKYVSDNIDENGDGYLSKSEIKGVVEIDCSSSEEDEEEDYIKSLKGIEIFTKLAKLDCSWNSIAELDVSMFKGLTELNCDGNPIGTIDVRSNGNLYMLSCCACELSSLDVTNNTRLMSLQCEWNSISKLDISRNTRLIELSCEANELEKITLSGSKSLEQVNVGSNRLTKLSVSKLTKLNELKCGFNQLTELNVSKNTRLTKLECDHNKLKSIDVSNNKKLTFLDVSSNELSKISIRKLIKLNGFNCSGNPIKKVDLSNCPRLLTAYKKSESKDISKENAWKYYELFTEPYTELCVPYGAKVITDNSSLKGWVNAGAYYYYKNGKPKQGWFKYNKKWYFLNPDDNGSMATGLYCIDKKFYLFADSGKMLSNGWHTDIDGDWHYISKSGVCKRGWKKIKGKYYYFKKNGVMARNEKIKINGKTYKFDKNGVCKNK